MCVEVSFIFDFHIRYYLQCGVVVGGAAKDIYTTSSQSVRQLLLAGCHIPGTTTTTTTIHCCCRGVAAQEEIDRQTKETVTAGKCGVEIRENPAFDGATTLLCGYK